MRQNEKIISPKQPFFVMATSRYYKAVIMDYGISHFYCFYNEDTIGSVIMAVPDGCVDILFCCDEKEPSANLCGSVLHPANANIQKGKYYFGIRFLPGCSFNFKDVTMSDVIENQIPFLQVIQEKDLFEKITSSREFHYQIRTFMEFYLNFYEASQSRNKNGTLKNFMLKRIHETAGQIKIQELSEESNYSVRYINKIFTEEFGLSPKVFCKLMRFQHLLSNLNELEKHSEDKNLAQLAISLGYFDQSHMMKDFYELSNTTPGKYIHSLQETEYKKRIVVI